MSNCLQCDGLLAGKFSVKFCSRSCSAKYNNKKRIENGWSLSSDSRLQISKKLTKRIAKPGKRGPREGTYENRVCTHCSSMFVVSKMSNRKYCSKTCSSHYVGGYREGSGRAKTGYYKGIYCGSTYELVWVIYNLDNNNTFIRFPGFLEHNKVKYYPDFLIDNTIIEIKGYEKQESVDKKTKVAQHYGYNVTILRKEQLQTEFNWVSDNYKYKKLFELYDDYKPTFNLVCSCCEKRFTRDSKPKTDVLYCSRKCAGKGHKGITNPNGRNQYTSRDAASVAIRPSP